MPKILLTSQHDYVFGLNDEEFKNLCYEVDNRRCFEQFGSFDFEELAKKYGRNQSALNAEMKNHIKMERIQMDIKDIAVNADSVLIY